MSDAETLFAWANDPETRRQSFTTSMVQWEAHLAWLRRLLEDPDRVIWMLCNPAPVASIRFAADGDRAVVSVQVAPEERWRGYGQRIVSEASALYLSATGRPIDAEIKPGNVASLQTFEAAGYRLVDDGDPRRYEYA